MVEDLADAIEWLRKQEIDCITQALQLRQEAERQARRLERTAERLQQAIDLLRVGWEAEKTLPADVPALDVGQGLEGRRVDRIAALMRQAGAAVGPWHVDNVQSALEAHGEVATARSLRSSMGQAKDLFVLVASNTFALCEWGPINESPRTQA